MSTIKPTDDSAEEARRALAQHWRTQLAAAEAAHEPADDETLAAYVDGALDSTDREAFEIEMENDPLLKAEVGAVASLRRQMVARPFVPPRSGIWKIAAAILITLGAAVVLRLTTFPAAPHHASPSPALVAALKDVPGTLGVDAGGMLHGATLDSSLAAAVAAALRDGSLLRVTAADALSGKTGVLLGPPPAAQHAGLAVLEPVGTAVRATQPLLRWSPEPGGRSYRAEVFDSDLNRVSRSSWLAATEWRVSAPLVRGGTYLWQVTVDTASGTLSAPAPPAPEARFRVVDADTDSSVAHDLAEAGTSHVVAAVVYARAGLYADAARELKDLARSNPGSPLLERWRTSLPIPQ